MTLLIIILAIFIDALVWAREIIVATSSPKRFDVRAHRRQMAYLLNQILFGMAVTISVW